MINESLLNILQAALKEYEYSGKLETEEITNFERARGFIQSLQDGNTIASIWSVEDVFSLMFPEDDGTRGHTNDELETARAVLRSADENHDATIGINWDTLQFHLDTINEDE